MTRPTPVPEPRQADPTPETTLDPARVAVLRSLASRSGGHIVAELAEIFATTAREDVAALLAAVERADRATADELAHKLKGAARSLGATALAEICHRTEDALRGGAPVPGPLLAELSGESERACSALCALAASLSAPLV